MNIRQFLFLFLLVSMIKMSNGQSYVHFPDSNAVWHETYILTPPPQIWSLWYNGIGETYYNGDTVINNIEYHKLYRKMRNMFCSRVIEGTFYCGALREDTIHKKIFALNSWDDTEHLLYDFNLKAGDTLPCSGGAIVDFIDTIVTNDGISRSRWNVLYGYYPSAVIEGIGGTHGLLSNLLIYEYPDVTMCFEGDSKQTIYINDDFGYGLGYCNVITDSCYFLSSSITELNETQVFPNPAKTNAIIRLRIPEPIRPNIQELSLINQIGQRIHIAFRESDDLYINAPDQPGIYFIQIRTQQQIITKKIIINQ